VRRSSRAAGRSKVGGMPYFLEGLQHLVVLLIGVSIGFALMHALRG
jgi:hypothetical protein